MYLRLYEGEKGWHENKQELVHEYNLKPSSNTTTKLLIKNQLNLLTDTPKFYTGLTREFGLQRGMSDAERAVTTPRIGWRKLTDPGD